MSTATKVITEPFKLQTKKYSFQTVEYVVVVQVVLLAVEHVEVEGGAVAHLVVPVRHGPLQQLQDGGQQLLAPRPEPRQRAHRS